MKKLLCILFLLLVASVPACAESAPTTNEAIVHEMFANHSDEDLRNLFIAVQYELISRGYAIQGKGDYFKAIEKKEVTVPPGTYRIGDDIPAGIYTIVPTGALSMVTVKDSSGGLVTMHSIGGEIYVGKQELKDRQLIDIVGQPVIFKTYQGLGF